MVEGPTDAEILSELLAAAVAFFPVAGRVNVLRVADRLGQDYIHGVVCVADADFDDEAVERAEQWFLVFTDNADIEAMCYLSPALERILAAWGSRDKLTAFGGTPGVRAAVADVLQPISVLRRGGFAASVPIRFDEVSLHDVIARDGLSLNVVGLVDRLARASSLDQSVINGLLGGDPPTCVSTGQLLLRGKDCLMVVDIALRKEVGSLALGQVKDGLALRSIILAVREADFAATLFSHRLGDALARALT